nr:hypothetical protein [Tanacetum cinerariifolium]
MVLWLLLIVLRFKKCNMRFKTDIKPKEATFQVVLDAFDLTPFYRAFLVIEDVPAIYIHEKTQVYGAILLKELTNQAMLESLAYQTYYAFASREKTPKPNYVRKKVDSDTSPKQKPIQATKGTIIKTTAKLAKSDKKKQPVKTLKAKGLAMLSEVALTKAEQLKLATKRRKKDFHISHARGSGDRVDTQSKIPDEHQQKTSSIDEGTGTIPGVPNVPIYASESDKEIESNSDIIPDPNQSNEEYDKQKEECDDEFNVEEKEKIDDEETMYDDEVTKKLYEDVNVNLGNKDADITNAEQGAANQQNVSQQSGFEQEEEDAHVTLTLVLETQKTGGLTQSSSVLSDFTRKLLNLDNPSLNDTTIASLMDTIVYHEITSATTIPPPPHFFNPPQQEATPTPTPTTFEDITLFTSILDFVSIFKFNERVINLEKDLEKAQDEKREYIEPIDSTVRTIIKEEVNARLPQILPKATSDAATLIIEKNITESLEVAVLTRSSSQPQSSYQAATTLSKVKMKETKIKTPPLDQTEGQKEENKVTILRHLEIQSLRKRSLQAPLKAPHNLDISLQASLPVQRSQVILLKTQASNKINSSSWETMMNNLLTRRLPKLTGLRNPSDLLLLILIGGGDLSRKYSTSMTKTKAATYELRWIEDLVPKLWIPVQLKYDQHAYLGTSHWGSMPRTQYSASGQFGGVTAAADELSPTSYLGPKAISNLFQGGGEDITRSLTTSKSVHAGIGTGAGMEILAIVRYAGCGGGVLTM